MILTRSVLLRARLIPLCAMGLVACVASEIIEIDGVIDANVRDRVRSQTEKTLTLHINSPGGRLGPSLETAEFLSDRDVKVVVEGLCNSACSTHLLAIADEIAFIDDPLVGFHQTGILMGAYEARLDDAIPPCPDLLEIVDRETALLESGDVPVSSWRTIDQKLVGKNITRIKRMSGCGDVDYTFEHRMWYPTSAQLKRVFNLSFRGTVCADDFEACTKRLAAIANEGPDFEPFTLVIGDRVHTFSRD